MKILVDKLSIILQLHAVSGIDSMYLDFNERL